MHDKGKYLATAHSTKERDELVKEYENMLMNQRLPGVIHVEHRRVRFTHQWDIYLQ